MKIEASRLTPDDYQEVLKLPNHLIVIMDPAGVIQKISDWPFLNGDPDPMRGRRFIDFVHLPDRIRLGTILDEVAAGARPATGAVARFQAPDGTLHWTSWSIHSRGGNLYALGTLVDGSPVPELSFPTRILETMSEGIIISDGGGKILFANEAQAQLLGVGKKSLKGHSLSSMGPAGNPELIAQALEASLEQSAWRGEWEGVRMGKPFTADCRVSKLELEGQDHFIWVFRDVTESKEARRRDAELSTRFKTFFEQSTLPMEIYSLEGEPLEVNHAWEKLFQTTREQLRGYNVLTDPTSRSSGFLEYLLRARAGEAVEVPAFLIDPAEMGRQGRQRWLEAWFSPVKSESGEVRELAMILKDVTQEFETKIALEQSISDRKSAEEKFRALSDRLSLAVKVGRVGIWEWKPGREEVIWDETTEEIYGYAPGTFPRTTEAFMGRVHPDDRGHLMAVVNKAIEGHVSYVTDHRIIRPDGRVRWLQGSGMAFYDLEGRAYQVMGTVIDITERKESAQDQKFLAEASDILSSSFDYQENLAALCEFSAKYFCDGCLIDQLHPDGTIARIVVFHPDPAVKEKMDLAQKERPDRYEKGHPLYTALISGKTILHDDIPRQRGKLQQDHGENYCEELRDMDCESSIVARLKGRESLLGTVSFFTLRESQHRFDKRHLWLAEEVAYRISMALENSLLFAHSQEAIRARDEFLSIASHELKTPLTSLTLQIQMRKRQIDRGLVDNFTKDKILSMIEADNRQILRINRLIDDMLDIARIKGDKLTMHKEKVPFCKFLSDVIDRFRPQLEAAGCPFQVIAPDEILVEADIYRIEQVVVNLLTNAMKYGSGRPIKVEVHAFPRKVKVYVHDKGTGIAEVDIERIFERFERAVSSSEVSGLGLGLYISRQIMEQHGGTLSVMSEVGNGSTFVMELPTGLP